MKKLNLLLAAFVATFAITGNSYAFFNVAPIPVENKAVVKVTVAPGQDSYVSVMDPKGKMIHNETIKEGGINSRSYDLTSLNDGIYSFYSSTDYGTTLKKVEIQDSEVSVISKKVDFKPFFKTQEDQLLISFLNNEEKDIELVIEAGDKVYFDGNMGSDLSFQKMVNLSNLQRGEYYAMMKVGARTFGHTFVID